MKNKSTHTPGPWKVVGRDIRADDYIKVGKGGYFSIAYMANPISRDDIMDANARLIAAAPELLEACKIALSTINDEYPKGEMMGPKQALKYAIAKAEGRE